MSSFIIPLWWRDVCSSASQVLYPLPSSALAWTEFSWKPLHICFLGSLCVSGVCCQQPQTGQALQPGRSLLFPVCWNSFGSISREINCCLFITTFQFWRLNWCCIGMGAQYNMGLEILKYWSWLNPSQRREELISLSGLIIYFILTHKKCLPNVLLHLGTAQKSLSPYKRFHFSCLMFICLFVLLGTRHGSKQLPETLKKIQGWVDLGQFCVLAINQSIILQVYISSHVCLVVNTLIHINAV